METIEAKRKRQREWVARRRVEWLARNGPCVRCGSSYKLEIDHIDPDKKVSHRIFSWSEERREAELRKCQVFCSGCHAYKHKHASDDRHGTTTRYRTGCRCDPCRHIHSQYNKSYRG